MEADRPAESGSTAEQEQLHKQGTDYIKDQVQKAQFSDDGTGKGIAPEPTVFPQPSASNPGVDGPSGDISEGSV